MQTIYRLWAHLSEESYEVLDSRFKESPYPLRPGPVEIFASYDELVADVDDDVIFIASAVSLKIGWDPDRGTSPAVVVFDQQDFTLFRELSSATHVPALPHNFAPVMIVSEDVVRRRNYVNYINSLSNSWYRSPLQLQFDSWSVTADAHGPKTQIDTSLTGAPAGLIL